MTRRALVGFIFINIFVSVVVAVGIIFIWSTTSSDEGQTIVTRVVQVTSPGQVANNDGSGSGLPADAFQGTLRVLTQTLDAQDERIGTQDAQLATAGIIRPTNTPLPSSNDASSGGVPTLPPEVISAITLPPEAGNPGGDGVSTALPSIGGSIDDGCQRYFVVAGDNCSVIAARFEVSVEDLISINDGINSTCSNLRVDQEVLIPGDSCQPPPTSTPQPSPTRTPFPIGTFSITNTPAPTATNPDVEIVQILNFGDVNNEQIDLRNTGTGVVEMAGWTLEDDDGNVFVFPDFRLQPSQVLRIFTRVGQNTPGALYWNQQVAVWEDGDVVTLLNAAGDLQSRYEVGNEAIEFGE